jgi:hypothetical protein
MYGKVTALLLIVCMLFGCAAYRVEIKQLPPGAEDFLPSEVGILIPAIVRSTNLIVNGQTITPEPPFLDLVLQKIRRTHVFAEVSYPLESGGMKMREKAVNLELQVTGSMRVNEARNWIVGAVNVVTLFLFSSALQFRDDFDVSMQLRAVRYDGEFKYYRSRITGINSYYLLGGENARREAEERVVEKSLNVLMRQVMQDIPFFAMETSS